LKVSVDFPFFFFGVTCVYRWPVGHFRMFFFNSCRFFLSLLYLSVPLRSVASHVSRRPVGLFLNVLLDFYTELFSFLIFLGLSTQVLPCV